MNMMLVLTVLLHLEREGSVARQTDRKGKPVWSKGRG